jgi:hypothetical protein
MTKKVKYISYVEDTKKHHFLIAEAAKIGTKKAVKKTRQALLAVTYVDGVNIIRESPKGIKKIIGTVGKSRKVKVGTKEKIS